MSSPTKALPTAFPTNAAPPTVAVPTALTPLWRALTPSTVAPTPASTAPPMAPLDFLGPARMMTLNSARLSSPSLFVSARANMSSIVLSSMPFLYTLLMYARISCTEIASRDRISCASRVPILGDTSAKANAASRAASDLSRSSPKTACTTVCTRLPVVVTPLLAGLGACARAPITAPTSPWASSAACSSAAPSRSVGSYTPPETMRMRSREIEVASCAMSAPKLEEAITGSPLIDTTRSPLRSCPQRIAGVPSPMAERMTASPSNAMPSPKPSSGSRSSVTLSVSTASSSTASAGSAGEIVISTRVSWSGTLAPGLPGGKPLMARSRSKRWIWPLTSAGEPAVTCGGVRGVERGRRGS